VEQTHILGGREPLSVLRGPTQLVGPCKPQVEEKGGGLHGWLCLMACTATPARKERGPSSRPMVLLFFSFLVCPT
jgi:hypothetical protein